MNDKTRLAKFGTTAAVASIPVLSISGFAALTIYAGNTAEFSTSLLELVRVYLPYVAIIVVLLGLPGAFLGDRGRSLYCTLLAALGVLTWLQGNILVWNYGALDGRSISWTSGAWRGVLDMGIWVTLLYIAARMHERLRKPVIIAAVATFAIQTVSAAATLAGGPGVLIERSVAASGPQDASATFSFSAEKNIVHIVLDGLQTDLFLEILAAEGGAALREELEGFTLFQQNLGVYPYTQLTVPALLTGQVYRNDLPVDEFITTTLQQKSILGTAIDAGYEVDIAAQVGLINAYGKSRHTNAYNIVPNEQSSAGRKAITESTKLLDLALFRSVPHFAKALVHRDELWVFQAMISSEEHAHLQYFLDVAFLKQLSENMSLGRDLPVYKMFHLMLAHQPTVGNADCEYEGRMRTDRENVTAQATCSVRRVIAVLRRMKELGIYDGSLIVLMADHGAWVPVEGLRNGENQDHSVSASSVAMAIPMLAIKRPGDSGKLSISDAQTSIVDIPATIADILDLSATFPGKSAFAIETGEQRERFHAVYGYGYNDDAPGYLFPMREYTVTGEPFDAQSWQRGPRHLPGRSTEMQ